MSFYIRILLLLTLILSGWGHYAAWPVMAQENSDQIEDSNNDEDEEWEELPSAEEKAKEPEVKPTPTAEQKPAEKVIKPELPDEKIEKEISRPEPELKPPAKSETTAPENNADEDELMLEPELENEFEEETGQKPAPGKPEAGEIIKEEPAETKEQMEGEEWEEISPSEDEELKKAEAALEEASKIPTSLTTLEECKRVALLNDKRVQVALREIKYQRCKIREAEREFLPQVKGTWEKQDGASDQASGGGKGGADQGFNGLKYGVESTQILFYGGKLTNALKQEKTKLAVAKKKYEQARQETINKVEKAYYELVKAQMIFQIQTDLSKSAEIALSFSREAYRQGLNNYHDFLNVQSQTDQTYYQLLSAQQDIALAELELRNACNVDASVGIQINAVLTFTDFNFNYSLDECLGLAFKNRPDLAVNEMTTLADLYAIKVAVAENMPKLECISSIGKNGQSQQGQPMELGDEWSLKFQATWLLGANSAQYGWEKKKSVPKKFGAQDNTKDSKTQSISFALFDKLDKVSEVAKSFVQKTTSEADLMELRGKVAKEVDENYFNYQKTMTNVTASLSKIKFREKDLEINRAKQMMNEVPLSQVLTSELQLGEERVNYVKALADYYTSISGLFKAMGLSK